MCPGCPTVCGIQKRGLCWALGDLGSEMVGPGSGHFLSLDFPASPAHRRGWDR